MKKKIFNLAIIFGVLIIVMFIITGCETKTENVIVYINDGLNESQIKNIEENLKSIDEVNSSIQYTTKAEVYEEAKEKLGQDIMEMSGYTKYTHPFPTYFTIEVKKNKKYDDIIKKIENIDGVKTVEKEKNVKDVLNAEINYIKNRK